MFSGLYGYVSVAFAGLLALLKFSNWRLGKKQDEVDSTKAELAKTKSDVGVKEYQAINIERKDIADEQIEKLAEDANDKLDGDTTYSV